MIEGGVRDKRFHTWRRHFSISLHLGEEMGVHGHPGNDVCASVISAKVDMRRAWCRQMMTHKKLKKV